MDQRRPRHLIVPGLRVIQRGRDAIQIGFEPGRALVLPRTPAVQTAIDRLATGAPTGDDPEVLEVVDALAAQGYLVEGSLLSESSDVAALALADPHLLSERLERRGTVRVGVLGGLAADALALLTAVGLTVGASDDADVVLIAKVGEVDRDRLDRLVRAQVPHLVVRLLDGVAIVGPFVEPGRSACLRCIDAHHAEVDPPYSILASRYAAATDVPRLDATAEPVDTALATLALSWAVRDVVSHVDGIRPSSWSTTIRLHPTLTEVTSVCWLRHPACGCSWVDVQSLQASRHRSVTMEA
ncbi:MAG: hypothetical protein JWR35_1030 [Marmoricola sp.]|jgi:bacteriocin biosynthesis cyclodehydratase domain-containing protein|nr:hypothetical protein [Marmoricola sp.]